MKKLLKIILYPLLFLYAVVVFVPKTELYYALEEYLDTQKIIVSQESTSDLGLSFSVENGTLFYDGIKAGKLEDASILFALFYNKIALHNFALHQDFKDFFPGDISKIEARQIFYQPHIITIKGDGAFGSFFGDVNLMERKIVINLKVSSKVARKYRQLLRGFKKTKEGYVYEQSF